MKEALQEKKFPPALVVSLAFAAAYLGWQLWGLRYTTHDDIFFNLYAWVFSGDKMSFADYVAHLQGRLAAYINMPIILGVDGLSESGLYDVLNIGSILAVYASLIHFLSKIGPVRDAMALNAVALLLFPLHYYFSFPQGYPVMACWGLCLALLSAGLLGSYLREASHWKIAASVILFVCSLWGSEYNFVLHPILLCAALLNADIPRGRRSIRIGLPYLLGWLITVIPYLAYSAFMHSGGADVHGRVVPSFDLIAWIKTFFILEEKAFLPVSLWRGIVLTAATAQGVPEIPSILNFSSLAQGIPDRASFLMVLLVAWVFCSFSLHRQQFSKKVIANYSFVFVSFVFIPCAVLATSSHYQQIVLAGYLQGHLATFYAQLGMTGLVFLLLSAICNTWSRGLQRTVVASVCGLVLAGIATVTFVYNNVNRQVMSANRQKWEAMRELVHFVRTKRPDLEHRTFYAPAFWTFSGVSAIPGNSPFNGENYWTEYSRAVLKSPLKFRNSDYKVASEAVFATYFSTPTRAPVVALYEQPGEAGPSAVSLVAPRPVMGTFSYQFTDGMSAKQDLEHWVCNGHCSMQWNYDRAIHPQSMVFRPSDMGPIRLLAQFVLRRGGEYGMPLRQSSKQ